MNMPPHDATHVRMGIDDLQKLCGVAQTHAVEPGAAHRQGLMVHADHDMLAHVVLEGRAEPVKPLLAEAARIFAREKRVEKDERPVAEPHITTDLEGRDVEQLVHELGVVVITRQAEHGHAEPLRLEAESLVARPALVLDDIAGDQNRIGRPARVALRVLEHGHERIVGIYPAHPAVDGRVQMRIADMQDSQRRCCDSFIHKRALRLLWRPFRSYSIIGKREGFASQIGPSAGCAGRPR